MHPHTSHVQVPLAWHRLTLLPPPQNNPEPVNTALSIGRCGTLISVRWEKIQIIKYKPMIIASWPQKLGYFFFGLACVTITAVLAIMGHTCPVQTTGLWWGKNTHRGTLKFHSYQAQHGVPPKPPFVFRQMVGVTAQPPWRRHNMMLCEISETW